MSRRGVAAWSTLAVLLAGLASESPASPPPDRPCTPHARPPSSAAPSRGGRAARARAALRRRDAADRHARLAATGRRPGPARDRCDRDRRWPRPSGPSTAGRGRRRGEWLVRAASTARSSSPAPAAAPQGTTSGSSRSRRRPGRCGRRGGLRVATDRAGRPPGRARALVLTARAHPRRPVADQRHVAAAARRRAVRRSATAPVARRARAAWTSRSMPSRRRSSRSELRRAC